MAPVTPGRQQYYDGEQEIFLPDKIRYKINRPKHWAQSVDSQLYTRDVEQALLNYCRVELKHNVLDPERGFDLDLTLKELNLISQATDETIQAAESGQLAEMYAAYDAANDHLEQIKDIVYRDLSKLLQGVEDWQKEVEEAIAPHAQEKASIAKSVTTFLKSPTTSALKYLVNDLEAHLESNKDNDLQSLYGDLYEIVRQRYAIISQEKALLDKVYQYKEGDYFEVDAYRAVDAEVDAQLKFLQSFSIHKEDHAQEGAFWDKLNQVKDRIDNDLGKALEEQQAQQNRKDEILSAISPGGKTNEAAVRSVYQFLASNMIIKESKYRYQEEQHLRYEAAVQGLGFDQNTTLREFAVKYNNFIDGLVMWSHGYKSPKIDANYDDFDYKTINPITSSIFYYFFSASQASRLWGNVILGAAKYPNEKIRKAYLRFFSQGI